MQLRWHKIKRGLISGTKFLPSTSSRLNILFWCQSLRIIEQSAASQTLHFAQIFNRHARREIHLQEGEHTTIHPPTGPSRDQSVMHLAEWPRVISKTMWFSHFLDKENIFSHRCSDYLNMIHKVKCVSPPWVSEWLWNCRNMRKMGDAFTWEELMSQPRLMTDEFKLGEYIVTSVTWMKSKDNVIQMSGPGLTCRGIHSNVFTHLFL